MYYRAYHATRIADENDTTVMKIAERRGEIRVINYRPITDDMWVLARQDIHSPLAGLTDSEFRAVRCAYERNEPNAKYSGGVVVIEGRVL